MFPILVCLAWCGQLQATDEPLYRRWAVISSPGLAKGGLADLLTVMLPERTGIELVERDRIAAVVQELTVANALGAAATAERIKLGALLKADALLLLSEELVEGQTHVLVVVADTLYGARLAYDLLPCAPEKLDELVIPIAAQVQETRSRYRAGVQRVIGVPDFVNLSLTHDFDHLQSHLAGVVQGALLELPGCAVLEVEEAQAIRREMELAADRLGARVVPLFVEGEYEVEANADRQPHNVHLTIAVVEGKDQREQLTQRCETAPAAAEWLRRSVVERVGRRIGLPSAAPLSTAEQLKLLTTRAETVARLGDFRRSIALREAAVLLAPDEGLQRVRIVHEYAAGIVLPLRTWSSDSPPSGAEAGRWITDTAAQWRLSLEHLEHVIRRGAATRCNIFEALTSIHHALCEFALMLGTDSRSARPVFRNLTPSQRAEFADTLPKVEAQRRQFVLEVLPIANTLEPGWRSDCPNWEERTLAPGCGSRKGIGAFVYHPILAGDPVIFGRFVYPHSTDDLSYLTQAVHRVGQDEVRLTLFLPSQAIWVDADPTKHGFREEDYVAFIATFCRSEQKLAQFYGQATQRIWQFLKAPPRDAAAAERTIADLAALKQAFLATRGPGDLQPLENAWRELESALRRIGAGQHPYVHTLESTQPPAELLLDENARLAVQRFPWTIQLFSGQTIAEGSEEYHPSYTNVLHRGPGGDVFWDEHSVASQDTPGQFREFAYESRAGKEVSDVVWDGRYTWIGIAGGPLYVTSAEGRANTADDENALPPHDRTLKLAPLAPGKVLAAGAFGTESRAWLAIVTLNGDHVVCDVFHEAKNVWQRGDVDQGAALDEDTRATYVPVAIREWRCSQRPHTRVFLVFRGAPPGNSYNLPSERGSALAVDPDTRTVAVCPMVNHRSDCLLQFDNGDGVRWDYHSGAWYVSAQGVNGPRPSRRLIEAQHIKRRLPKVAAHGGYLYLFDDPVIRFDPRSGEIEELGPDPQRKYSKDAIHGHWRPYEEVASTFTGLLLWSTWQPAYQLIVREDAPSVPVLEGTHEIEVRHAKTDAPLVGATVELEVYGRRIEKTTGADGRCSFTVTGSSDQGRLLDYLSVCASNDGFARSQTYLRNDRVTADAGRLHKLALAPLVPIGGVVTTEDGQPLPHAFVLIAWPLQKNTPGVQHPPLGPVTPYRYLVVADEQGRWREYVFADELERLCLGVAHERAGFYDGAFPVECEPDDIVQLRAGQHRLLVGAKPALEPARDTAPVRRTAGESQ